MKHTIKDNPKLLINFMEQYHNENNYIYYHHYEKQNKTIIDLELNNKDKYVIEIARNTKQRIYEMIILYNQIETYKYQNKDYEKCLVRMKELINKNNQENNKDYCNCWD